MLLFRGFLILTLVALSGAAAEPLRILATLPALHSWAAKVAGPDAVVETLPSASVGPHDFQFRPSDLRRLARADVVVMNGLGVDGWMDKALRNNSAKSGLRVVTVADGLKSQWISEVAELSVGSANKENSKHDRGSAGHAEKHDHHDHAEHGSNPHLWLDPVFARHGVSNILDTLVAMDPAHSDGYRSRAAAYLAELEVLDAEIRSAVARLQDRRIVTFHDAFPYFCRRYGLELVGVVEEVPSVEPSPRYLTELVAAIRKSKVRVVFSEPQFHPRLVRRLAEDLGIKVGELDVLETGTPSPGFYVEGQRRNLKSLEAALR
jgi:ABC-type Zn uptake system ZnuABC Zn-binding protein ZnuA